jgi:uncharacterized spore protein YtfJ
MYLVVFASACCVTAPVIDCMPAGDARAHDGGAGVICFTPVLFCVVKKVSVVFLSLVGNGRAHDGGAGGICCTPVLFCVVKKVSVVLRSLAGNGCAHDGGAGVCGRH